MAHSSVSLASTLTLLLCICSLQTLAMARKEKLQFTYYGFETRAGPNVSLLAAAGTGQGNLTAAGWGSFLVFDNTLQEGPAQDSKLVGKHTGTAVATSIEPIFTTGGVYMVAQFIFGQGSKYNGSTITVIGTVANALFPWELIVPGGTGYFRGCKGYSISSPVDATTVPPVYVFKWDFFLSCK